MSACLLTAVCQTTFSSFFALVVCRLLAKVEGAAPSEAEGRLFLDQDHTG